MTNSFDFDPKPDVIPDADQNVAVIRTSDRINFKRCRRRWGWQSHLRGNLGPKEPIDPLWFGTGMHYALEDFHGYNLYGAPADAFEAFCIANKKLHYVPGSYEDFLQLGRGMMDYYELWLSDRDPLKTFWHNDKPQVEVRALIDIPFDIQKHFPDSPYTRAVYSVTIDRVVEDELGQLWPIDYKSARQIQTQHFATDPQIGAYYWALTCLYGRPIGGFIYQQHRKDVPQPPRMLSSGKLSTDVRQLTTHRSYRKALVNIFGEDSERWPKANLDTLNALAIEETQDSDRYIRRDKVYRNEYAFESEGAKILMELEDMLNPALPLYPNPTRDCPYCPFYHACVSIDDGSDWEHELQLAHAQRPKEHDSWRHHLPPPQHQAQDQTFSLLLRNP
jgi:PD-(D/E)XK nuclease superfamily